MIIYIIIKDIIYGLLCSIGSIFEIYNLFVNNVFLKYIKLILFNIVLLAIPNIFFNYLLIKYQNIFYFIYFIKYSWNIPLYICSYLISMDKIGDIVNYLDIESKAIKNIDNIEKSIYFLLLSNVFYLLINISSFIPYIGKLLLILALSISYSYFCLEYTCLYKNIENIHKITIIEQNSIKFLGFGSIYTLAYLYFDYITFYIFFICMLPLSINRLMKMNVYTINQEELYNSKIFIIPIYMLNIILSIIDSYVISYYNMKLQINK